MNVIFMDDNEKNNENFDDDSIPTHSVSADLQDEEAIL